MKYKFKKEIKPGMAIWCENDEEKIAVADALGVKHCRTYFSKGNPIRLFIYKKTIITWSSDKEYKAKEYKAFEEYEYIDFKDLTESYNCFNILDYIHEALRACDYYKKVQTTTESACYLCKRDRDSETCFIRILRIVESDKDEIIDEIQDLQDWSNTHPEKPKIKKMDKFLNLIAGTDFAYLGAVCHKTNGDALTVECKDFQSCENCIAYWNEEVEE